MSIELRLLSALEKTMPGHDPIPYTLPLSGFMNELLCFQLSWRGSAESPLHLTVESPLSPCIRLRRVLNVPVQLAVYPDRETDDDYLAKEPGCYPDLLRETDGAGLSAEDSWQAVWVDVEPQADTQPGTYAIAFAMADETGTVLARCTQTVTLLPGELPEQQLIHTKWFHADCLMNYYGVEAFSEEHWRIIELQLQKAAARGINMTLMPIHTPPLDTAIGGERPTVQLVDVYLNGGVYSFGMDKVRRWIRMCRRAGLKYFEIAHLYTQWGAKAAPKIMAWVEGEYKRIFGWETCATGEEYRAFLSAYIPALREVFREEGIEDRCMWHISDEPNTQQLPDYLAAKQQVMPLLEGCAVRDALSSFAFYQQGVVDKPIVSLNHIVPFLEADVPDLWGYYCCGQINRVSNQFIAMPSHRNRILGAQLFKHRCAGFLQWGYNFYYTRDAVEPIDPYAVTDAACAWPAGDPFQVYPGKDGAPEESIRMAVTALAMQDHRALSWLASLTSHEDVVALMEDGLSQPLTFADYPRCAEYLLRLREKVNQLILQRTVAATAVQD